MVGLAHGHGEASLTLAAQGVTYARSAPRGARLGGKRDVNNQASSTQCGAPPCVMKRLLHGTNCGHGPASARGLVVEGAGAAGMRLLVVEAALIDLQRLLGMMDHSPHASVHVGSCCAYLTSPARQIGARMSHIRLYGVSY